MAIELSASSASGAPLASRPAPLSARDREIVGRLEETARAAHAAAKSTPATPRNEEADRIADAIAEGRKAQRDAAKSEAREKVQKLLERLRLIKQFASDNPEVMAKQLAQLGKDLKRALADYRAAGGPSGGMAAADAAAAPTPSHDKKQQTDATGAEGETTPNPERAAITRPQDTYKAMRDEALSSEAAGDMDFLKLVKGVMKKMREYLEKAKLQTAIKGPNEETKKAFEETDATMKEIQKTVDDMDRDIRASSPAAGLFIALVA